MQYFFEFSLMSFKATPVPFCIVFRLFCPHSYQLYQLYRLYSFMHPIFSFYFCCIHFTQGRYTIIGWDFGFSNKPIAFFLGCGAQAAQRTIIHFYVISIEIRMLNRPENMDIMQPNKSTGFVIGTPKKKRRNNVQLKIPVYLSIIQNKKWKRRIWTKAATATTTTTPTNTFNFCCSWTYFL